MDLYKKAEELINSAKNIVVLQADNPDGDSLGSSLALESILSEKDKNVHMVCGVNIPTYLRYLPGWDRVENEIPHEFDLTIIVDTSTESLFEKFSKNQTLSWIKSKPVIVIDHHQDGDEISFAKVNINDSAVATGEVIYKLAKALDWPLETDACDMIAISIMSDSLGLISDATSSDSIRIIAELVDNGVKLAKLDQDRKDLSRKQPEIIKYKGELLERISYDDTGRIAEIVIPWKEIELYSPLYNPSMLVIDDMRSVEGVDVAIAYKTYNDGKVTAKIRCNFGKTIGADLAKEFGGGGHPYAAGFKIQNVTDLISLKKQVNEKANQLLDNLENL